MDGRKSLFSNRHILRGVICVLAMAGAVVVPRAALGQAMGKAVVDDAPAVSEAPAPRASMPMKVVAAPVHAPPVVSAETTRELPGEAKIVVPRTVAPTEKAIVPAVRMTAAPTTVPAVIPPLPAVAPATVALTPAAPATSAAALPDAAPAVISTIKPAGNKIEQEPIRPRPAAQAVASVPPTTMEAPASGTTSTSAFPSGLTNALQVMAALAVVVGLIFMGKAVARKYLPGAKTAGGKGVVEILARHPLCKTQALVLVRIGSQIVALNQGKDSSESVLVISEPEEVAKIIGQIEGRSPKSIQAGFTKLLANARMDLEKGEEAEDADDLHKLGADSLDEQLEEMAAAKRQLMELRQHVRTVRDRMPRA